MFPHVRINPLCNLLEFFALIPLSMGLYVVTGSPGSHEKTRLCQQIIAGNLLKVRIYN